MSLNYDMINSLVQDDLRPNVVDNIFESSALLAMLMNDGRVLSAAGRMSTASNGGTKILQPLEYAQTTAVGTYSGHDVVDITPPELVTAAEYTMKNYYGSLNISHDEELQVSGDRAIVQMVTLKTKNAEKSLKTRLANDLYSGSGSSGLIGLDTAIDTGTYGGIDGSTYTWWKSGVDNTAHTAANMKDSTNASYLLKLLQTGWKSCKHNNETPNLILVSQDLFDIAETISEGLGQFNTPTSSRSQKMASLGFNVIEYRGVPMVVDDFINDTNDPMYMLNTNYFTLYYHPMNNFAFTGFKTATNQPHAKVGQITFTGQTAISARRNFYRWSDLNN